MSAIFSRTWHSFHFLWHLTRLLARCIELTEAYEELHGKRHAQLPNDFKVTDNALATLASCLLDLGADDLVVGPYVKRLRRRERDGAK